jgi:SAM-dependent methyltransferase
MAVASTDTTLAPPRDDKAAVLAGLIRNRIGRGGHRVLVVGCGSGIEAATLAEELDCEVVGIDLRAEFDRRAAARVQLKVANATALDFDDQEFDFAYSYHALEHIPNYRQALTEMRRVVRAAGYYCVGTPNRARLLGYLGAAGVDLSTKLKWNVDDWKARLTGRFRNEYGAHAGFTPEELGAELQQVFGNAEDISMAYYTALYSRHARLLRWSAHARMTRYLLPSVYFFGRR